MKYSQYVMIIIIFLSSATLYKQSLDFQSLEDVETQTILDVYTERLKIIINETIKITELLEELIILHNGNAPLDEVERLTTVLFDHNIHINISYAPNGVIEYAYPIEGNEAAIGHKLLEDPITKNDSLKAKRLGIPTLSKPYELRQGNVAAVVRDPVFIDKNGSQEFWGFIAIAMETSQGLIQHSKIDSLERFHYEYKLDYLHEDGTTNILYSKNYVENESGYMQTFETKYGLWELSVYHKETGTEKIRRAALLWLFYITFVITIFCTIFLVYQKVKKSHRL